jgi:hypothetical protein
MLREIAKMNTIPKTNTLLSLVVTSLLLTGCFSSSNDNSTNITDNTTIQQSSISTALAIQKEESEPAYLDSVNDISNDISELFGELDNDPITLKKGETLNAIFDRVGS